MKPSSRGKNICNELKAVRKSIAEENGIPLEIKECTYEGPCCGTCPRCEREVWYLENALAQKIKIGKVATVAGLALALGSTGNAAAQAVTGNEGKHPDTVAVSQQRWYAKLEGVVLDSLTKEPLPFVNIIIKQNGKQVMGGATDFDGKYAIKLLPGEYELETVAGNYWKSFSSGINIPEDETRVELPIILLKPNPDAIIDEVEIYGQSVPIIEIGPEGQTSTEIQGVPLRIQY